jgi:nucleoid-associated protein YgaU
MGLFDKDPEKKSGEKSKADFSNVQGGSSSTAPETRGFEREVRSYTVVAGDSLSKIAKREYGDAQKWQQIYEANRDKIKDPDLIYPGQVLNIPAEK